MGVSWLTIRPFAPVLGRKKPEFGLHEANATMISSIRRFIASESAGGIVLALAAIVALVISNSALAPQ